MAASLTSLWLKSMRRMGKAQQAQGRRLFKSLTPKASKTTKAAKVVRKSPAKSVKPARPTLVLKSTRPKAAKPVRKAPAAVVRPVTALPGSWQRSYFSLPGEGQLAPARRMQYWLYWPSKPVAGASAQPRPLVSCCTVASKPPLTLPRPRA